VSVEKVASALRASPNTFDSLLAPSEIQVCRRCLTPKRRAEFVAGRLAGKLAFVAEYLPFGLTNIPMSCVEIPHAWGRPPSIFLFDRKIGSVSLSHSGRWAVAFVSLVRKVAVDVEDDLWQNRAVEEFFSSSESTQLEDHNDARLRWTLKECCFKLANDHSFDTFQDAITVVANQGRAVAIPAHWHSLLSTATLGVLNWGSLTVAFAFCPRSSDSRFQGAPDYICLKHS